MYRHPLRSLIVILLLFAQHIAEAQNYVFAQLSGDPVNTSGWNLVGAASIGATAWNTNPNARDEVILTRAQGNQSGGAFFNTPINITNCQIWTAEFDFRMFDGTNADGMTFCFLQNPPTGFVRGQGLGIPGNWSGLVVGLDNYRNCNQAGVDIPKVWIRYGERISAGSLECFPGQPTTGPVLGLRSNDYQNCRIEYNNGNIRVLISGQLVLTGFYQINFPGYFGLTAATGGSTDTHSFRNFVLLTQRPILLPPNAGRDTTVCNGSSVRLGAVNQRPGRYLYNWFPTTGLDDPTVPNPIATVFNNTGLPQVQTYFLTTDTLDGVNAACSFSDEVRITVLGIESDAGPDMTICSGEAPVINVAPIAGRSYEWSPPFGLSNPNVANPRIILTNFGPDPVSYKFELKVTNIGSGCVGTDSLEVFVNPQPPKARISYCGPSELCSRETATLTAPDGFAEYLWSTGSRQRIITVSSAGRYWVRVRNQNGCWSP